MTLTEIRDQLDYLQHGDGRKIGNEPTEDDILDLLRELCTHLKLQEERIRDLERRFE